MFLFPRLVTLSPRQTRGFLLIVDSITKLLFAKLINLLACFSHHALCDGAPIRLEGLCQHPGKNIVGREQILWSTSFLLPEQSDLAVDPSVEVLLCVVFPQQLLGAPLGQSWVTGELGAALGGGAGSERAHQTLDSGQGEETVGAAGPGRKRSLLLINLGRLINKRVIV